MRQNHYATKQLENPQRQSSGSGNLPKALAPLRHMKGQNQVMKFSLWRFSYSVLTTFCLLGLTAASGPESNIKDVELRIGIVQRFGEKPTAKLQLEPTKGDRLKLKFKVGNKAANPIYGKARKAGNSNASFTETCN